MTRPDAIKSAEVVTKTLPADSPPGRAVERRYLRVAMASGSIQVIPLHTDRDARRIVEALADAAPLFTKETA